MEDGTLRFLGVSRFGRIVGGLRAHARARLPCALNALGARTLRPIVALGLLSGAIAVSPFADRLPGVDSNAEAQRPLLVVPDMPPIRGGAANHNPARASASPAVAKNPIEAENRAPGSPDWTAGLFPATDAIQGYASEISLLPTKALHLHVSVDPAASYRIDIYRLGWYGGIGARLMTCLPSCDAGKPGVALPAPLPDPTTGEIKADWPVTDTLRLPGDWTSGYYIAKLVLTSGPEPGQANAVPFILRAPPKGVSTILVQASVNTWQAYNNWGGKSLYTFNSRGGAATKVSFDRPFADPEYFYWEYQLVRFVERERLDVSYTTDVDTARAPAELLRHRLVIVSGHDEYWSKEMRDAFDAAKAAGTNLAFIGANIGYWQIRYEEDRRTIVEYRDAQLDPEQDPSLKTVAYQSLTPARPECDLLGIQYQDGFRSNHALPTDYAVNPAALDDRWFAGTGFTASSTLPGLVGYEWDGMQPGCPASKLTVLFHATGPPDADAVRYGAPSGAQVFSSGSLQFVWGLDDWGYSTPHADPRLQRFMRNALEDLAKDRIFSPASAPGGVAR